NFDSTTRLFDLYAASTSAPGTLVPLNTSNTTDALYGNTFTGDSSHIFFYTAVNPSSFLGTLQGSAASSASQQPTVLGTTSNTAWAVGKTSVAFADNITTPPGSSLNSVDIEVVDLAGTGKPTRVATGANATSSYASFFVNPAGDAVVYTINATGGVAPG